MKECLRKRKETRNKELKLKCGPQMADTNRKKLSSYRFQLDVFYKSAGESKKFHYGPRLVAEAEI